MILSLHFPVATTPYCTKTYTHIPLLESALRLRIDQLTILGQINVQVTAEQLPRGKVQKHTVIALESQIN